MILNDYFRILVIIKINKTIKIQVIIPIKNNPKIGPKIGPNKKDEKNKIITEETILNPNTNKIALYKLYKHHPIKNKRIGISTIKKAVVIQILIESFTPSFSCHEKTAIGEKINIKPVKPNIPLKNEFLNSAPNPINDTPIKNKNIQRKKEKTTLNITDKPFFK